MITPLDSTRLTVDPLIKQWTLESGMVDVTAAAATKIEGKYLLCNEETGKGEVIVVTGIANYAWARTNVQDPPLSSEGVQMIAPGFGNNFFIFEPRINGQQPAIQNAHMRLGAWTTAAGATAADIKTSGGSSLITADPAMLLAILRGANVPLFAVKAGQSLSVLFSLVQDAANAANVLPRRYSIGGSVAGTQRVDYAAVAICGMKMPEQYYAQLFAEK